ncbi:hypothetical protein [Polaribacter sp. IC073]|uniref:hypothetical protein n=1 Tax=Polaribacter sp. IC073 TaxID=2508540 RepID=UPI0011BDE931|nr:hypothetical protein [Polaribacter sp. IC073]TXD48342.1 hypothetical protein ES045_07890 [Polaribacter sp. IC073]
MNKKAIINIFPILGLALLLLLSPCKIQNFIQGELDFPQTETSKHNKTTIVSSNCDELRISSINLVHKNTSSQKSPAILADFKLTFCVSNFPVSYTPPPEARNHAVSKISLYILYQNFKDYL